MSSSNFNQESLFNTPLQTVVSFILDEMLAKNDDTPIAGLESQHYLSFFYAFEKPGISIEGYLDRMFKYSPCSRECFVLGLIYIDRIIKTRNIVLSSYNIHRFLLTSVLIAAKYLDDHSVNNAYYARVGGITLKEMNVLEIKFLALLNFDLHVSESVFTSYKNLLYQHYIRKMVELEEQIRVSHLLSQRIAPFCNHFDAQDQSFADAAVSHPGCFEEYDKPTTRAYRSASLTDEREAFSNAVMHVC